MASFKKIPVSSSESSRTATVNLVKLARELVATKWGNPLIEVTCNNSGVEVQSFVSMAIHA